MNLFRGRLAAFYIFFNMLPSLILGVLSFVMILLLFQALRLAEFMLIHGVQGHMIMQIIIYLSVSFLPAIFPMSTLLSVLLTYGRLSTDSEIVAFKSVGLHMGHISLPAIVLSIMISILSMQSAFFLAPWGNRQFEVLITKLSKMKASINIREGTFSEGFFNLVLYANEVDKKSGVLKNVFIYDERDSNLPITIIAKEGKVYSDPNAPGHYALLHLKNGDIHRHPQANSHTKVQFSSYSIKLSDPIEDTFKQKSSPSLTYHDIQNELKNEKIEPRRKRTLLTEFHKRWAISVACFIFALLGVGLGTVTNRRNVKSGAMVICIACIVLYWMIYITCESMARNGILPIIPAIWLPNLIFGSSSLWFLKKSW